MGNKNQLDSETIKNNPQLLNLLQGKLDGLIGKSSGYLESLPSVVKDRIVLLEQLDQQKETIEQKFNQELLELEKKYLELYRPLYDQRAGIVNGAEADQESQDKIKGIPDFWLTCLMNHPTISELINERDQQALKKLKDIRMFYLKENGVSGIFYD